MKNLLRAQRLTRILVSALALLASASLATAQQLDRAIPEVGEPGDLVILRGTGLGGTTDVAFHAVVGGFVGVWTVHVAPLSVSATEVRVVTPLVNSFVPFASSPFGWISVSPAAGDEAFFFMEQTNGALTTPGIGTTQASGIGKPVVSFTTLGPAGVPGAGSIGFDFRLENATPGSVAVAALSVPAAPPHLLIGDGTLVLHTSGMIVLTAAVVTATGDAVWNSPPIPASATGTIALQWGVLEAGSGLLAVSNALQVVL